ncbi:flagellar hook-length control protein FliK, partial [Rhizobium leguminosarum]|uniref:flagellar hook-length control protein FliK n=1 Tax=Rhizobium leguminosarum TaxID=384 RepID=UPI003F98D0AD
LDLGLVTATMRLSGDALNIDLKVDTGAAYRQMKEDHGKILEALRSQGYAVENVTISMAPVERVHLDLQRIDHLAGARPFRSVGERRAR